MARKINISQLKSQLRQAEQKQKRAIADYNRAVKKYNNDLKRAVDSYNRFVREYNATARRNRQIISQEIRKLNACANSHSTYSVSVQTMQQHYADVNAVYQEGVEIRPCLKNSKE